MPRVRRDGTPFDPADPRLAQRREVYFLRAVTCDLIKIGAANDASARIRNLRLMSPDRLELMGVMVCQNRGELEAELHRRFAGRRCHGEWFRPSAELLYYIHSNATAVPGANDEGRADWEAVRADLDDRKRAAFELLTW